MRLRLDKPWIELTAQAIAALPGQLGVYQVAAAGVERIVEIGYAGGHSRFGLRSELARQLEKRDGRELIFRYEVTMQYMSRYQELLMLHLADHGELPPDNREDPARLGRLS